MKTQHFAPSRQPRWSLTRAIRDHRGTLLAPKPTSNSTGWQEICSTKRQKHEPRRKMHGQLENIIKNMNSQYFAPSKQHRWSLARAIRDPHGALLAPKPPSSSTCLQDICAKGRPRAIQKHPRGSHCAH